MAKEALDRSPMSHTLPRIVYAILSSNIVTAAMVSYELGEFVSPFEIRRANRLEEDLRSAQRTGQKPPTGNPLIDTALSLKSLQLTCYPYKRKGAL